MTDETPPSAGPTEALDASHPYSTVQLVLDDAAAQAVRQAAATCIAPDDVHPGEGLETCPHITVLYGLQTDAVADVLPLLQRGGAVEAVIQGIAIFSPEGKDYDVVVHRIASPGAVEMHAALVAALPHVSTHPVYRPHLTLGYVGRGCGATYADLTTGLEGMVLQFPTVEFNSRGDVATTIPLLMAVTMDAMGVELPTVLDHPNRLPFEGILTRVDTPSDIPPAGSKGHRVCLARAAAEEGLASLIGMGVDAHPFLTQHAPRVKIGVFTEGWLDGDAVRVRGILYARDFPAEVAEIQRLARQGLLGMSFELAGAEIVDPAALIWQIRRCTFTGAAILQRAHAAYRSTALAAQGEGGGMDDATDTTVDTTLVANMDTMMQSMRQMAGMLEGYQACHAAMQGCVNMRGELDSLAEALEHLVRMHNALHDSGMAGATGDPTVAATGDTMAGEDTQTAATGSSSLDRSPGQAGAGASDERLARIEAGMADIQAAVKLLTDEQATMKGLLTDQAGARSDLVTDGAHGTNGGRLNAGHQPQRRTLVASGDYPRFVAKYGFEASKDYSELEIDTLLRNAGVTDPSQRLAVKLELERQGQMR